MRAFPTVDTDDHFYYRDNRISKAYEPGSLCVLAPGDVAWESDLRILQDLYRNEPTRDSLQSVVAKYLLNRRISLSW